MWEEIDVGTDDPTVCEIRYKAAGKVVKNIMSQCINTTAPYSSKYFLSRQMALSNAYYNGEMKIQELTIYALLNRLNEPDLDSYLTSLGKGTMTTSAEQIGLLKRFGIYYE